MKNYIGLKFGFFTTKNFINASFVAIFIFGGFFVAPSRASATVENVITQINFITSPQTINVNATSTVFTVETQDVTGVSSQVGETIHLNLVSNSATGQFSSNSTNWVPVITLTMNSNWANRSFYYRDSTAGAHTLTVTAQEKTWTPAVQTVTINKLDQTISFGALADRSYGDADIAVTATASSGLPVVFSATPAEVCSVVSGGAVHVVGVGKCSVTASQVGDDNYNPAPDVAQSFNINAHSATIILVKENLTRVYNGSPQSVSVSTSPEGLSNSVTYDGSSVAPTNVGSYSVFASTTDPNYSGTDSATLIINKANPTISWGNPADVVFGVALGDAELNATTSVPGTFVYNPVSGTVLGVGVGQILSVSFTPTDSANYNATSTSVVIKVNPAVAPASGGGSGAGGNGPVVGSFGHASSGGLSGGENTGGIGVERSAADSVAPTTEVAVSPVISNQNQTSDESVPVAPSPVAVSSENSAPASSAVLVAVPNGASTTKLILPVSSSSQMASINLAFPISKINWMWLFGLSIIVCAVIYFLLKKQKKI